MSSQVRRDLHLESTAKLSGVPETRLKELAELYADPKSQGDVAMDHGFQPAYARRMGQQHVYNIHLLTGKISEPGNSPFSLTGQPSACGTAREVGTFSHRLPADMVVANPEHRKHAEEIWKLPPGTISGDAWLSRRAAEPHAARRQAQRLLGAGQQQHAGGGQPQRGDLSRLSQSGKFIVVSDVYPTVTALSADLILPSAMWVEKEGAYGNAERRTRFWHQLVDAPGEARSDLWQLVEFSKRFTTDEVWPAELLATAPEFKGKTLYEVLFANGSVDRFPTSEIDPEYQNAEAEVFGFYLQKGLFEEYASFGRGHGHDLAPFDTYHKFAACAGRWSTARRPDGAIAKGSIPMSRRVGHAVLRLPR